MGSIMRKFFQQHVAHLSKSSLVTKLFSKWWHTSGLDIERTLEEGRVGSLPRSSIPVRRVQAIGEEDKNGQHGDDASGDISRRSEDGGDPQQRRDLRSQLSHGQGEPG